MKIREDFVTNSSSSSYIICFARIADKDKATDIIEKYKNYMRVISADEVDKMKDSYGEIGADWCGATVDVSNIKEQYPNDLFVLIEDSNDAIEDWETEEIIYDEDFDCDVAIAEIKEDNGFDNISSAYGEGRNG